MQKISAAIVTALLILFFLSWGVLSWLESRDLPSWVSATPLAPLFRPSVELGTQTITQSNEYTCYNLPELIRKTAKDNKLDPAFLLTIVKIGSNFNCFARDKDLKAAGLMLLRNEIAQAYSVSNLYYPQENLFVGVSYLRNLLVETGGDLEKTVLVFHFGRERLDEPEYREDLHEYRQQFRLWYQHYREEELNRPEPNLILIANIAS